jgi:hypothetical protein
MKSRGMSAFSLLLSLLACAEAPPERGVDDGCGPNASFSEEHDHCHCDEGFEKVGTACLAASDDGDDEGSAEAPLLDLTGAVVTGRDETASDGTAIYVVQAVKGETVLRLEGYVGLGAPDGPATVALSGRELDYATCSVCVVVQQGCHAHDDHFHCERTLMPAGGSIAIESLTLGDAIAGHLHEVDLREVQIADDFRTTPVDDGASASVAHWDFAAALVDG